jgi:hypothetical protein
MVRPVIKTVIAAAMIIIFSGCGAIYYHNPEKAREKANEFLSLLYSAGDYDKAYSMTDKFYRDNFGMEKLVGGAQFFLKKYGKFEGTRADAYFTEGGSRDITIFYTAVSEGGITYQKITLHDYGRNGYSVSAVEVSEMPFKGYRLLKKFKE